MKRRHFRWRWVFLALLSMTSASYSATHNVAVNGFSFSPKELTVTNGDTVVWSGLASFHTVTPNAGVTEPFCGNTLQQSCTVTFLNAGSFAYHCNPHQSFGMTGVVRVVSAPAGVPPVVSITNPPSNALFAAPGTVLINVSATDSDGTVASVQLLTNNVPGASDSTPPFSFSLNGLAAGNYVLRARATDNQSLSATSGPVSIRVVNRPLLSFARSPTGPLQFSFSTVSGVSYVVEGSSTLTNFFSIVTNAGNGSTLQFVETNGGPNNQFYRVRLE
jgi:plastocyanin